jgi:hypothetical protein
MSGNPLRPHARLLETLLAAVPRTARKLTLLRVLAESDRDDGGAPQFARAIPRTTGRHGPRSRSKYSSVSTVRAPIWSGPPFRSVDDISFSVRAAKVSPCRRVRLRQDDTANVMPASSRSTSGEVRHLRARIAGRGGTKPKNLGKSLQMVYQDPYSSLNPRCASPHDCRAILLHAIVPDDKAAIAETQTLHERSGCRARSAQRYAFGRSRAGQRQRFSIARAARAATSSSSTHEPTSSSLSRQGAES